MIRSQGPQSSLPNTKAAGERNGEEKADGAGQIPRWSLPCNRKVANPANGCIFLRATRQSLGDVVAAL